MLPVLLLAVACSGAAGEDRSAPPARADATSAATPAPAAATVRLARLPESAEGDASLVEGVLLEESGCLYLEAAGPTRYLIASAVPGLRWDGADEVLAAGAESFSLGERVALGGSEASASVLEGQWVEPPGAACDSGRVWIAHSITPAS